MSSWNAGNQEIVRLFKWFFREPSLMRGVNSPRGTTEMEMGNFMNNTRADKLRNYTVIARLDDAIPLNTEEWVAVERLLNQVSEFVPMSLLNTLTESIISYADDQARRGYLLGQEDLVAEMRKKAARIA